MRLFILIPAALVFAGPAAAQNWQEYSYPDYSFRVTFPADPQIETTTYQITDDRAVEARVYSVHRDNAEFKVTVAELTDPGLEEAAVIDHAIKVLSEGGEVKVNIPHRINRVFGRQLSILQGDGSRGRSPCSTTMGGSIKSRENRFSPGTMRRPTPSDSCNRSYSPAAVLTARRTRFVLPGEPAANRGSLESPQLRAPQSRVMAAALNYAAVASNRSARW